MAWAREILDLSAGLDGELYLDNLSKAIYATDASVYREIPQAVVLPKSKSDIKMLIEFALKRKTSLIPRAAGTSLAGQCVGNGIVVDVSKYMTKILDFDVDKGTVRVQPGVIRDELNLFLKDKGLFFAPETSTANRAMLGGMVGNNSCGTNSIKYGTTRDHLVEVEGFLSDGSLVAFGNLDQEAFERKTKQDDLEGSIYKQIKELLNNSKAKAEIEEQFPDKRIHRRNTGYAVDRLISDFEEGKPFNFAPLIAGSEGTLLFITEVLLNCTPLPPFEPVLVAVQFNSVNEALKAVMLAMKQAPYTCELMDKVILDCTKENLQYKKYRFFLEEDPEAVLLVEFRADTKKEAEAEARQLVENLTKANLGYAFPTIPKEQINNVWSLRKAGLGLLANIPGDKKAVAVIEDTAVALEDLPEYIEAFTQMMENFGQKAVYYAHAGAGEIHLRPILDLKKSEDVRLFKDIALATAKLVKKYKGSLSGEHGDGRVRASFLPLMIGDKNYALLKEIKKTWDPKNIFNPGKIIDAPAIDKDLRYKQDKPSKKLKTLMNFDDGGGFLKMAEKCNGSGDCRKTALSGGTMCPSYMATRDEKDTTRARANALREFMTQNNNYLLDNGIKNVLDLCLSCKGCKSECPSNVDMAALKAEYTYQYNEHNGIPIRSKLFGNVALLNQLGSAIPRVTNWINTLSLTKTLMGIATERSAPKLANETLKSWYQKTFRSSPEAKRKVYFFADEFTNFLDVEQGKKAILLLDKLGYKVEIAPLTDSGRAFISKGMLKQAKKLASNNVWNLIPIISEETPLIGIEPSAIFSFKDEYVRLIDNPEFKDSCIVSHSFLIDDFIATEYKAGRISPDLFTKEHKQIVLHGHCHQKALSDVNNTVEILNIPENYHVELLPTGCCGMAGSFGYEKEHYDVSMKIGELVLFPAVRNTESTTDVCAPGTSCRHQIFDGTGKTAKHSVEILWEALKK